MAKSRHFQRVLHLLQLAARPGAHGETAEERLARAATGAASKHQHQPEPGRRAWLAAGAGLGLGAAVPMGAAHAAAGPQVAVVGAGLAGLRAALTLARGGASPTVYEADSRVGGRVWSLRGVFPEQVAERGAELIDLNHLMMRRLARHYGLAVERYGANRQPADPVFFVQGSRWTEAEVLQEAAGFMAGIQDDLAGLSQGPNAFAFNETDRRIDLLSISDYLTQRGAGPLLRAVLAPAFAAEFGRDIDQLSALVLLFALVGREPQDVFGPVQLHLVEGNDALPSCMAADLPTPPRLGHRLVQVARTSAGRVRLTFATPGGTVQTLHDAAVLALPATLMREVEFAASAGLTASHRLAIERFQLGSNSKHMVGFRGRPWLERNASNGTAYADLAGLQATWETNPSEAAFYRRGVLTDYAGGRRAAQLDPTRPQAVDDVFLQALETVYPGSAVLARRDSRGRVVSHIENWARLPLFKGAYSSNAPGYFTTLEGRYGLPAGNIVFAGEHTDSFYAFQGYMEGALRSGTRAARQLLAG